VLTTTLDGRIFLFTGCWRVRQVEVDGRQVLAVAPCPEDIIVSKLACLSEKDREFVEAYHTARPLNHDLIVERIKVTKLDTAFQEQAIAFVGRLAKKSA